MENVLKPPQETLDFLSVFFSEREIEVITTAHGTVEEIVTVENRLNTLVEILKKKNAHSS